MTGRESFISADGRQDASLEWLRAVERGEPVLPAQRNAFVSQSSALMDALAAPERLLVPAPVIPSAQYFGPVSSANGQRVPVVGSIAPPEGWLSAGPLPAGRAGLFAPGTPGAFFAPSEEERRRLWLALYSTQRSMASSFETINAEGFSGRDAGALPVIAVVVIAIAGIGALAAVVANAVSTQIREVQETARHAAQIQQAAAEYVNRLRTWQTALQTNPAATMPPPGPSETAVARSPAAGTAPPAERAQRNAWEELAEGATRAVWVGGGLVALSVAGPGLAKTFTELREARAR